LQFSLKCICSLTDKLIINGRKIMSENPYVISAEDVMYVVCAAFEGGSNYWMPAIDYVREPAFDREDFVLYGQTPFWNLGGSIRCWEDTNEVGGRNVREDEGGKPHVIDVEAMRRGIRKAAEHLGLTPRKFVDEHDAESADLALQYATLGEVIYG
jgi:hypothetical protein